MKNNNDSNKTSVSEPDVILIKKETPLQKLGGWLFENKVMLLFGVLCFGAVAVSGNDAGFVVQNVFVRFGRNGFTVLALLIPILAGMGLNFSIVIGAIAAQIGLFFAVDWGMIGMTGMLVAFLIATPLAMLFGFGVGRLFNRMKGAEMIAGLIIGFFADGLYQLLFLYIMGGLIPIKTANLVIPGGVGIKNALDLTGNMKYALDLVKMTDLLLVLFIVIAIVSVFKIIMRLKHKQGFPVKILALLVFSGVLYALTYIPAVERYLMTDRLRVLNAIEIGSVIAVIYAIWRLVKNKLHPDELFRTSRYVLMIGVSVMLYGLTYIPFVEDIVTRSTISVLPFAMIAGLCMFNSAFLSTRIGQNMRTVGQSQVIANASGIHVDRVRVLAMILSTVFASWGQLIYLQNIGTFSTYGAHLQVGQFAIAALLVGGASIQKATNKQAITGIILFHTLFIVAPEAGKKLFDNAMIGEYFRVFISYGVIALALAMHAWQRKKRSTLELPN
ncbi:MAG TPA: ABC transporter permease [Clostridia bacterium]|nr:ABC transporter permease [Clostridia bacterium]